MNTTGLRPLNPSSFLRSRGCSTQKEEGSLEDAPAALVCKAQRKRSRDLRAWGQSPQDCLSHVSVGKLAQLTA